LTNLGERLYSPNTGSKVLASLFELQDLASEDLLKKLVVEAVSQEPRVNLLQVDLYSIPDNNAYQLSITFSLVNIPQQPIKLDMLLKRVR
jgi:phage baseplate assembly protein W